MICRNCGFQCDDNASACPKCGSPVGYNQQNAQNQGGRFANLNQQFNNFSNNFNQQFGSNNGFRAPIKQKSIVTCIILSIVTCGIYGIIWFINIVDDLNTASGDVNGQSGVVVFLLSLITCNIYGLYWAYKAGEKVSTIRQRNGLSADSNNGILYLILNLFGLSIVTYALVQNELNNVASN